MRVHGQQEIMWLLLGLSLSIQIFHNFWYKAGPKERRCLQSGAGDRERSASSCVCVCVWVYVELRRLTNDAHQVLNGHNKLLYLLHLRLYPYLAASACLSAHLQPFAGITQ